MVTYLICNESGNLVKISEDEFFEMSSNKEILAAIREKYKRSVEFYRTVKRFQDKIPISSRAYRVLRYFRDGLTLLSEAYIHNIGGRDSPNIKLFSTDNLDSILAEKARVNLEGEWEEVQRALRKILNYLETREDYETCAEIRELTKQIGLHQLMKAIGKA
jgi:hypothetical protein